MGDGVGKSEVETVISRGESDVQCRKEFGEGTEINTLNIIGELGTAETLVPYHGPNHRVAGKPLGTSSPCPEGWAGHFGGKLCLWFIFYITGIQLVPVATADKSRLLETECVGGASISSSHFL